MALSEEDNSTKTFTDSDLAIWQSFMDSFREKIGTRQFQTFGSFMELAEIANQTVIIEVPRDITRSWLIEKHGDSLDSCFKENFPEQYNYKIKVNTKAQTKQFEEVKEPSASVKNNTQSVKKVFPFAKKRELNPAYTFENFMVGTSNNFAYSAARAVAEKPAQSYNPLFIYGDVGLGKTHLLQAIGHRVSDLWPQASIRYVSAEKFTNQIIQAIQEGKRKDFKYRYRNTDLLLVDDIQFFAQTKQSQQEFFHTFNELYENGKAIAFCSDRPPHEIPSITERLRNRFEMGFIVDVQPPDYETRMAILQKKAIQAGITLSDDILKTIAENITDNVRALEGSLNQLTIMSSFSNEEITPRTIKARLANFMQTDRRLKTEVISLDRVQKTVAEHFNISISDLKSKRRTKAIAYPRQIAMYLSRELTDCSFADIGEAFGGRDHSTVIHGTNKIDAQLAEEDIKTRTHIERIKSLI